MDRQQLRTEYPEIAAIVDELRPHITNMAFYVDGKLVAGREPADPPGTVWVSAESYIRMREFAAAPEPTVGRSKRE